MQTQSILSTQSVATQPVCVCPPKSVLARKARVAAEVVQLNRVNLKSMIEYQRGKFCSVVFVKADNTTRTLTGRMGVKSYLAGGVNKVVTDERPYMTMFDIQLRQYRTINLSSMTELRASGKRYLIID